ncbi:MAG: hypothetical protein JWS12_907 [Candidatus Saccharibacteria bacterium]|nr:hypothetical protein [Candidatus Saccharibacteria bacterium]
MRRAQEIADEEHSMATIGELSSAFEGIASMRIAQIKNQVLESQDFFNELWNIYRQIAVDPTFGYGRKKSEKKVIEKGLFIAITAEGSFSGDIDEKLITWMLKEFDPAKHDIIVIGHHGALQLAQHDISFKRYYKLPEKDQNINVEPIIQEVEQYQDTTVYYQSYVSLMVQDVKRITLGKAVEDQGKRSKTKDDIINESTYIFEPSTYAVVNHLERSMMQIALSQVIFNSKLAQYASRFRAMSSAHTKADDSLEELHTLYNRARRANKDERLKEIINGLHKLRSTT